MSKNLKRYLLGVLIIGFSFIAHSDGLQFRTAAPVTATAETAPVHSAGDAADDPVVWLHPSDASRSIIFGANKRAGIHAYNLEGSEVARYLVGNINNIDIRYQVNSPQGPLDILGGSDRTRNSLIFFSVNPETGALQQMSVREALLIRNPYGFCFYQSPETMDLYAVSAGKDGLVEQFLVRPYSASELSVTKVKEVKIATQTEGCVADDFHRTLYVGEEAFGVWRMSAEPTDKSLPVVFQKIEAGKLKADVEGLAIYATSESEGFIVISSQGDNSFALYDRSASNNNAYRGSFTIVNKTGIDGVSDTDGLDILAANLGPNYPEGIVVVQDGDNRSPQGAREKQNFKIVDWRSIRTALKL